MCVCTCCWLSFHFSTIIIASIIRSHPTWSICSACTSTPFYATFGVACARNFSRRSIRTRAPFHRLPVRERFQPATDKGKITKPRKLPENDAHPVASSGVALPEKEEDGDRRRQAPRIHGNSGWFRSHFQVNYFFLAIVFGPCGAHCWPDRPNHGLLGIWLVAGTNSWVRLWETAAGVYFRVCFPIKIHHFSLA